MKQKKCFAKLTQVTTLFFIEKKRVVTWVNLGIFLLALLASLDLHPESLDCGDISPFFSLQPSDQLQFGRLWQQIKRLEGKGVLYEMILQRREEIHAIKEHWKSKIPIFEPPSLQQELEYLLETGFMKASNHGCGAAYFLCNEEGNPLYVIKPIDEDILCLNNRKQFASPYNHRSFRVRDEIPLYRTAQAEALSFAIAQLLGQESQTPPTHLAILTHASFFDITDNLKEEEKALNFPKMGLPQREKFCSVQTYLADTQNLYDFIEDCLEHNLTDQDILPLIDHEGFENLCLLIWLLYDTDAHAGNLYVQKNPQGIYHLLKIDNGLTFPNANSHLLNALYFFPHAKFSLSPRMCKVIENLPIEEMIEKIHFYEMDDSLDAFLQRVEILQKLAKDPTYSIKEIDMRLHALELPEGTKIALNTKLSLEELQKLISYE